MADYYTRLSFGLKKSDFPLEEIARIIDAANHQEPGMAPPWLLEKYPDFFERHENQGVEYSTSEFTISALSTESNQFDMIIYGNELANEAFVSDVIHAVLEHHGSKDCIGFEFSHDCRPAMTDGFGGGACFITAGGIEFMSTNLWLHQKGEAFEKTATEEESSSPRP